MKFRKHGIAKLSGRLSPVYRYSFIPGHNETIIIYTSGGQRTYIVDLPSEVLAEMNISMGHAGLRYLLLSRWRRVILDVVAWWQMLLNSPYAPSSVRE